ncbi:MAG: stage III sporulation protein AA [Eubacteriales bacterium]|nr:stage III sporulation protein AA [Eubacteriales bacterium]
MNSGWKEALKKYLPEKIYAALDGIEDSIAVCVEEIRLRVSRPLMVYTCDRGFCVSGDGSLREGCGMILNETDVERTFSAITGKSPYAYEEEIRQGFLTLSSGIRAGLAGSAIITDGAVRTYKSISGINFRIPKEAFGISKKLLPYISKDRSLVNTLVISAPKLGKTTLVRDIARCAGSGIGLRACKVSLIDERQELAACVYGQPLFDVGTETDVISGVVKHTGVFMALRSLSPDVIVTDEIGKSADLEALREIANGGVIMVTTAHAYNLESLLYRLFFKKIFDERLFDAYVVLSSALGRITVAQIHNCFGQELLDQPFLLTMEDI